MNFDRILEEINKDYPTRRMSEFYAQIELDILFDGYNYIFIGVLFEDNKVILTDFADYAPLCNWEDKDIPDVNKICEKHHVVFRNYHIEKIYNSNQDIKDYLNCLLELKDKYIVD